MAQRLPLDLYAEVTTADGTRYRWDDNQAPGSRLLNVAFRSRIGDGFADGGGQLARRIDQDYPDLNLINTVTFTGADGSVAYEGRVAAMPRELSDRHSIGVTLTGWMAHTKDRKFQEIYVDRDLTAWTEPPLNRKVSFSGFQSVGDVTWASAPGVLSADFPTNALGAQTIAEIWYSAPTGVTIGAVTYQGDGSGTLTGWRQEFEAGDSDSGSGADSYTQTFNNTLQTFTLTTARRYLWEQLFSNGTAITPTAGTNRRISRMAVYGSSGVSRRTGDTSEPDGVYASDVIRDIAARFCPKLDTSGVQNTTYVIQHLAFKDRTYPYDAFLELNKFHLWHLGVWEGKRLDFRPYDLTDYDWEIRTDDPGVTFSPQGPSTEDLFNGIVVTYTDLLTGRVETLTPDLYSTIADTSDLNPWNQHGTDRWDEITLSTPTLANQALELGRAALADRNRPRTPGTITAHGYVRDRAGNYQPYWKVRAGDRIAITNFPNDSARLIVEAAQNVPDKTVTMSIDNPLGLLDAYMDRVNNALGARGLA